jgi:L-gulonolactone oxidase
VTELWTNWTGDQRCAPSAIERPGSEDELAAVVQRSERMRAVGSGHSFTDAACTDGVLIDLRRMNRVLSQERELVTVEAGITLHDLGERLAELGLAMENQGDIDRQTLAGALSTATHGTGQGFANLSSGVTGMRLVTATGVVEVSGGDELRAARVGVGALGAVSAVTLRCVPLFTLRRVDDPRPLDEVLEGFDELSSGNDHFEFFVFPYDDTALLRLSERGEMEPQRDPAWRRYVEDVLIENRALALGCGVARRLPAAIPAIQRGFGRAMSRQVRTDRAHRVYANRRDVRFTEMEYGVPREHGVEAVRSVIELVRRRRLPVVFPIEVRVAAADDAFLSTAAGRDTAYVAVHQYRGMEFESYFRAVERIMDDYGGRPHWGKRHYQSAVSLRARYPDWDRFQAVRRRLDPEGRFQNDYTERVLGSAAGGEPTIERDNPPVARRGAHAEQ